jgi:hypothetical protein
MNLYTKIKGLATGVNELFVRITGITADCRLSKFCIKEEGDILQLTESMEQAPSGQME